MPECCLAAGIDVMRILFFSVFIFFVSNTVLAFDKSASDCVDLSHQLKMGAADLEIRQIGCTQFRRQMMYQGQPYGEASIVELDGIWKKDSVDDEYESFARQIRWSWNVDNSVLIYEFIVDTLDKKTGDKILMSGTQIYKKTAEGKIVFDEYSQRRLMKIDGMVTVEQKHQSELYEPL